MNGPQERHWQASPKGRQRRSGARELAGGGGAEAKKGVIKTGRDGRGAWIETSERVGLDPRQTHKDIRQLGRDLLDSRRKYFI